MLLELGIASIRGGHWLEGADLFERLEKSYAKHGMAAEASGPRGALLLAVGRIDESTRSLERARAHESLAPAYAGFLNLACVARRDFRGALVEIDRGMQLDGLRESLLNSGLSIALCSGDRGEIERRLAAITDDVTIPISARHHGPERMSPAAARRDHWSLITSQLECRTASGV